MTLTFDINPDQTEIALLLSILNCSSAQLSEKLTKLAASAFEEYKKMILGQKVFTRGKDMMEYRLFILIKYLFDGKIPDEQSICALFQVTAGESRSLVRSIMSKYQYELRDTISDSLKEQVGKAAADGNDYKLSIQNQFFKDELNKVLGSIDPSLPMIEKDKGTIANYIIRASSYEALRTFYSL